MCLCYLNDIITFTESFQSDSNWTQKSFFLIHQEIKILGHLMSSNSVHPVPYKVKAAISFPTPNNVHDMRSFLRHCLYLRRLIKGFCYLAELLHLLLMMVQTFCRIIRKKSFNQTEESTYVWPCNRNVPKNGPYYKRDYYKRDPIYMDASEKEFKKS